MLPYPYKKIKNVKKSRFPLPSTVTAVTDTAETLCILLEHLASIWNCLAASLYPDTQQRKDFISGYIKSATTFERGKATVTCFVACQEKVWSTFSDFIATFTIPALSEIKYPFLEGITEVVAPFQMISAGVLPKFYCRRHNIGLIYGHIFQVKY